MRLDRRHIRRHKIIQVRICLIGVFLIQTIVIIGLAFKAPKISKEPGGDNKSDVGYAEKLIDPVAIFTLFLVVSTILLWRSTERLAALAARQASDTAEALRLASASAAAAEKSATIAKDTLIASNRAWIKVDFIKQCNVILADGIINVSVRLNIENVGTGPAINVNPMFWLISDADNSNFLVSFRQRCERLRSVSKRDIAIGHTLFPGQKDPSALQENYTYSASLDDEEIEAGIAWGKLSDRKTH